MIKFPYYPANIKIVKPLGETTLQQFVEANKNPKENIKQLFNQIREAAEKGEEKTKSELKEQLFYFTPCVKTDGQGRSYTNITAFNGIAVVEFDKIDFAEELRDYLFDNFKSCFCAYVSPSGKGTKTLWKIPVVNNVEDFKSYFYGLAYTFDRIKGFDPSAQNAILALYLSWDENLRYRDYDQAETWIRRGGREDSFKPVEGDFEVLESVSREDKLKIKRIVETVFEKIEEEQTAHTYIRNTSLWLGGLAAKGYFELEDITDFMTEKIESSDYCSKSLRTYLKTMRDMLQRGTCSPTTLT